MRRGGRWWVGGWEGRYTRVQAGLAALLGLRHQPLQGGQQIGALRRALAENHVARPRVQAVLKMCVSRRASTEVESRPANQAPSLSTITGCV